MSSKCFIIFALIFAALLVSANSVPYHDPIINDMSFWADYVYKWFMKQNCSELNSVVEETCLLMKSTEKSNYRVYGTEASPGKKIGVVFPDGDSKHKVFHDGIVILDPFPAARFGHPILVFHVQLNLSQAECNDKKGFLIADPFCFIPVNRSYCNRRGYKHMHRNNRPASVIGPNCGEMLFLPLVHYQNELPIQVNDRLKCFSNIDGFNKWCPILRSKAETNRVSCDPLLTNRNCGFFENKLGGRCSTSQTCDHAVLLSGGWNRQLSDVSTFDNIMNVKRLLLIHGFAENNIEMFYANGPEDTSKSLKIDDAGKNDSSQDENEGSEEESVSYYSSSLKLTMRNHIRTVCDSEYCADTLLIYMNSPARPDGSSLLWDIFDNGMFDEEEIYSPKELLRDIARCKANRVVILADQSYGGALVSAAEARFINLQNVVIFTSSDEFIYNATKDRLTMRLLQEKYYDICLNDFRNIINQTQKSPEFIGTKPNLLNSTLVGGPCTGKSLSLNDPETEKYRGCSLAPIV